MGKDIVIRARKLISNKLLNRRQCVVEVFHPKSAACTKDELAGLIATKFRADSEGVVVSGLKTKFGGGKSTAFALMYDNMDYRKKFEPKFRLRRVSLLPSFGHF